MSPPHLRLVPALEPAAIVRQAEVPAGAVFWYWGRARRVLKVYGSDGAAPVICEELEDGPIDPKTGRPTYSRGQLALWSADQVLRLLHGAAYPLVKYK